MSEKLPPIPVHQLEVLKKRSLLKAVDVLQRAFSEATVKYEMSRKDFAQRIGMKPSQFSRILHGRQNLTIETAEAILRAMEARGEFGFTFLDDIHHEYNNRVPSLKYQKRDVPSEVGPRPQYRTKDYAR